MTLFSQSTSDTSTSDAVVRHTVWACVACPDEFGELHRVTGNVYRVELIYDPADPFAVTMEIPVGRGLVTTWVFARELLNDGWIDGLEFPTGDVRVAPEAYDICPEIRVELSSPDGRGLLWLRVDQVADFLTAAYEAVPAGTEAARIDWVREWPELTGTAGGAP